MKMSASPPRPRCRSSHHAGRKRVPVSRAEKRNPHANDANISTVATMPVDLVTYHNQLFIEILPF